MYVLRLTQLYNILLLFYYWLLVSASRAIIRPIFPKKKLKKMLVHVLIVQKSQVLWGPIFVLYALAFLSFFKIIGLMMAY